MNVNQCEIKQSSLLMKIQEKILQELNDVANKFSEQDLKRLLGTCILEPKIHELALNAKVMEF